IESSNITREHDRLDFKLGTGEEGLACQLQEYGKRTQAQQRHNTILVLFGVESLNFRYRHGAYNRLNLCQIGLLHRWLLS
ncbi:hypothetical protein RA262_29020, partial [Pseudomonas syringae pv. tagetis]